MRGNVFMVTRYQKRISGPFMDRIDLHVDVPRVEYEKLSSTRRGEPSTAPPPSPSSSANPTCRSSFLLDLAPGSQ